MNFDQFPTNPPNEKTGTPEKSPVVQVVENGNDISFNIPGEQDEYKASLQCERNDEAKMLTARTIVVEKDFARQGLGTLLFMDAIGYARKNGLGFATDYGISEDADKLIQSLVAKGFNFVKNPNATERQGGSGKRIVTFDGSPVYRLEENKNANEGWVSREPLEFGRDYFQLQYDFAKALQEKTGKPLFEVVKDCTSILRFNAFNYDGFEFKGIKEGVTEENIVDMAYADYLNEEKGGPVEYHPEGSQGFGCFNYELEKDNKNTAKIHFMNAEFDKVGPLDKSKIEMRKKEMHDVLEDIKKKHPEVNEITGLSWLYNLPAYKRLFPQSYLDNLKIDDRRIQWMRGTTIWGQFFDSEYHLRKDLADELLRRVRELPADAPLAELFENGSPILPPLATHGPIEDFYKMYGIN